MSNLEFFHEPAEAGFPVYLLQSILSEQIALKKMDSDFAPDVSDPKFENHEFHQEYKSLVIHQMYFYLKGIDVDVTMDPEAKITIDLTQNIPVEKVLSMYKHFAAMLATARGRLKHLNETFGPQDVELPEYAELRIMTSEILDFMDAVKPILNDFGCNIE